MARINTNVPALVAQTRLRRSQRDLQVSLERLSSGLRINRGADDPAGLIASENLRSEIAGVTQAIDNSQRAINVIATAEGALNEVAALLVDVQGLIVQAANEGALSDEEIRANQLQIDSAVESITRIANTTSFAGRRLLDGSLNYVTSGVLPAAIDTLHVHGAQFGTQTNVPVGVVVTQSAQKAQLQFRQSAVAAAVTVEVRGNAGAVTLVFNASTTPAQIVQAVNIASDATGVTAALINAGNPASGVVFTSAGYGAKSYVAVEALPGPGSGSFATTNTTGVADTRDEGQDAEASINGARATGDGLDLVLNTTTLDLSLTLDEAFGIGSTNFAITAGGALFQLGPRVDTNQQTNVGIQSVAASRLGNGVVGFLSEIVEGGGKSLVDGKARESSEIVNEAIRQISVLRGRLGAFEKNTLQTNINQLQITHENLTASESVIRDTDFAAETSLLTRNQILIQAGTSVLALANSTPQSVLALLGG
ncbi:MAG: flagellin [Phycisphaerae bacterium]|nr:flagellin [Phycisphaerae bacterium]